MFKIVSEVYNLYGVLDTEDNVTEYYTFDQIVKIVSEKDIKIHGVNKSELNYIAVTIYYFDEDLIFDSEKCKVYSVADKYLILRGKTLDFFIVLFYRDSEFAEHVKRAFPDAYRKNKCDVMYINNTRGIYEGLSNVSNIDFIKDISVVDSSLFINFDDACVVEKTVGSARLIQHCLNERGTLC